MSKHQRSKIVQRVYELMDEGKYAEVTKMLANATRALPNNAEILAASKEFSKRQAQAAECESAPAGKQAVCYDGR